MQSNRSPITATAFYRLRVRDRASTEITASRTGAARLAAPHFRAELLSKTTAKGLGAVANPQKLRAVRNRHSVIRWQFEQRLRRLELKTAGPRNPHVYFFQPSGDANFTLKLAIRSPVKRKNYEGYTFFMDIIHHKGFEANPGRTTGGVPASPLVARFCLQNAAPRGSPATRFELPEACQRKKVHSLWTKVRALFQDLFSTPSTQDLEPTPGVSVILTPGGLLVYQWQIDKSTVPHSSTPGLCA
jgi:hypothetical protein